MTESIEDINARLRAKYLPQPQKRGRPPLIKGYDLVSSLLKEGPLKTSKKYNLDYKELRLKWNKLNQKLEKRRIKGGDRWWLGRCEVKGCLGFWIVVIDAKDEIANTSLCCPFHNRRKRRLFRQSGSYGGAKDLWRMPIYLEKMLMRELIKLLIVKHGPVVEDFFVEKKTDPGQLARDHNLRSDAEAEKVVFVASLVITQALRCLLSKFSRKSHIPKTHWAMRYPEILKDLRWKRFNSMELIEGDIDD